MVYTNPAISLNRLLKQCEALACEEDTPQWQLDQFVIALEDKYSHVVSAPNSCGMDADELRVCKRRIDYLRSTVPRIVGVFPTPMPPASAKPPQLDSSSSCDVQICDDSTYTTTASSSPIAAVTNPAVCENSRAVFSAAKLDVVDTLESPSLRFRQNLRREADQRRQLLSLNDEESSESRRSDAANVDFDEMMRKQREAQRRETEQLLSLTQSMKEQSLLAKRIVNMDKEMLDKSNMQAERNRARLQTESSRLSEINSRCCRCWLWLMIAVVCVTFLGMVVFIRLFQK